MDSLFDQSALTVLAERLVQAHVLREKEDIFYLTFQELHDVVLRTNQVDDQLIRQRKDAFRSYQALTPPRVLTSRMVRSSPGRTDATTCPPARRWRIVRPAASSARRGSAPITPAVPAAAGSWR